jgi:hypothetical protein
MPTWKKILVNGSVTAGDIDSESSTDGYVLASDGDGGAVWEAASGSSDYNVFADAAARNSVTSASRKEGYLAYTKDDNELRVYKATATDNTSWETTSNWLLIPHNTDEYDVVTPSTLAAADDDAYFFQLYNPATDTYKKLSQDAFFGWFATAFAQVLIDQGLGTVDTYSADGSNILGDLNGDGYVTTTDLLMFLGNFGIGAPFTIDWNATFQGDGAAVNFTGTNDAGSWKKITFESSDLTGGLTSTGIGNGFNDANDYLVLEDGTNFTLFSNLLGTGQIPDTAQATIKLNVLKTVLSYSEVIVRLKVEFLNNSSVDYTAYKQFPQQSNEDSSTETWEYLATENLSNFLVYSYPAAGYDEIRLTIEASSFNGTEFINLKTGTEINFIANN